MITTELNIVIVSSRMFQRVVFAQTQRQTLWRFMKCPYFYLRTDSAKWESNIFPVFLTSLLPSICVCVWLSRASLNVPSVSKKRFTAIARQPGNVGLADLKRKRMRNQHDHSAFFWDVTPNAVTDRFLRNVCTYLADYMASHPKIP